ARHLPAFPTRRSSDLECGGMHLGDGGRGQRFVVEVGEHVIDAPPAACLDQLPRLLGGKWRHFILQQGQLFGQAGWQQVAAGGQSLAEFDENRAEFGQRFAQTHAHRRFKVVLAAEQPARRLFAKQLAQAVFTGDTADAPQAPRSGEHQPRFRFLVARWLMRAASRSVSARSRFTASAKAACSRAPMMSRLSSRRYSAVSVTKVSAARRARPAVLRRPLSMKRAGTGPRRASSQSPMSKSTDANSCVKRRATPTSPSMRRAPPVSPSSAPTRKMRANARLVPSR